MTVSDDFIFMKAGKMLYSFLQNGQESRVEVRSKFFDSVGHQLTAKAKI